MESAKLPALGYTSALEALAEKFTRAQRCCRRSIRARRGPLATLLRFRLWNRSSRTPPLRKQRPARNQRHGEACR
jgi:hypothetical protein